MPSPPYLPIEVDSERTTWLVDFLRILFLFFFFFFCLIEWSETLSFFPFFTHMFCIQRSSLASTWVSGFFATCDRKEILHKYRKFPRRFMWRKMFMSRMIRWRRPFTVYLQNGKNRWKASFRTYQMIIVVVLFLLMEIRSVSFSHSRPEDKARVMTGALKVIQQTIRENGSSVSFSNKIIRSFVLFSESEQTLANPRHVPSGWNFLRIRGRTEW